MVSRKKPVDHPWPEGCWLRYSLDLRGIRLEEIGKKAHRTASLVSKVINGERRSNNVEAVLADVLGFESKDQLWAAASNNAKRRAG